MAQTPYQKIAPAWLRPVAMATVVLVHAGAMTGLPWPAPPEPAVAAPIAIQVVPEGQIAQAIAAPQQAQIAETNAVQTQPMDSQAAAAKSVEEADSKDEPPAEDRAPTTPTPSDRHADVQPVTESSAAEAPQPLPPPQDKTSDRKKTVAKKKRKHDLKETADQATPAPAPSRASALSQMSLASAVTGSAASTNYRSIVAAELNRRKFYPPAARASGTEGIVVVTFTVGANGRITAHSLTRSSGNEALDQAVHQMLAAVLLPPPPGGVFRATVPIRFDITR